MLLTVNINYSEDKGENAVLSLELRLSSRAELRCQKKEENSDGPNAD